MVKIRNYAARPASQLIPVKFYRQGGQEGWLEIDEDAWCVNGHFTEVRLHYELDNKSIDDEVGLVCLTSISVDEQPYVCSQVTSEDMASTQDKDEDKGWDELDGTIYESFDDPPPVAQDTRDTEEGSDTPHAIPLIAVRYK